MTITTNYNNYNPYSNTHAWKLKVTVNQNNWAAKNVQYVDTANCKFTQ